VIHSGMTSEQKAQALRELAEAHDQAAAKGVPTGSYDRVATRSSRTAAVQLHRYADAYARGDEKIIAEYERILADSELRDAYAEEVLALREENPRLREEIKRLALKLEVARRQRPIYERIEEAMSDLNDLAHEIDERIEATRDDDGPILTSPGAARLYKLADQLQAIADAVKPFETAEEAA